MQTPDLSGRVALVTGARVGVGYAVALRLLRAGAFVLAMTRFPHDAARRYALERDYDAWASRLRIHRLDLRHVLGVEAFAAHLRAAEGRLDILINNAAQTVRRPSAFYRHLEAGEAVPAADLPHRLRALLGEPIPGIAPLSSKKRAKEEGEDDREPSSSPFPFPLSPLALPALLAGGPDPGHTPSGPEAAFPPGRLAADGQQLDLRPHNTWSMRDDEVSALELVEVHVVNAVAPFLLCSRLKSLLARGGEAYVVNVSSSEGRFGSKDKAPNHPHTNMAKAALNMLTRTCAEDYARHGIYMNSVDPGWISFQQPYPQQVALREQGLSPPFDSVDAAARVCDPIFTGVNEGRYIFGKFLKDFREIDW
jgi:NAD(P)-dependent dehydrogenase (short-subunit alcohol dehydrogenase family)